MVNGRKFKGTGVGARIPKAKNGKVIRRKLRSKSKGAVSSNTRNMYNKNVLMNSFSSRGQGRMGKLSCLVAYQNSSAAGKNYQ